MQDSLDALQHSELDLDVSSPWFVIPQPRPLAKLKLICFAYAGGSANIFRDWPKHLDAQIEVIGIQLPGRAGRFKEPLLDSMEAILAELEKVLLPYIVSLHKVGFRYAFFGHSMGASVAFEFSRRLEELAIDTGNDFSPFASNLKPEFLHELPPELLIISGRRAPSFIEDKPLKNTHNLPQEEFFERLKILNGTPEELLQHHDLMNLMEPILRSDFKVIENWEYQEKKSLSLPLYVFFGEDDEHTKTPTIEAWEKETSEHCYFEVFPGDHFYLQTCQKTLLTKINKTLLATNTSSL